LIIFTVELNQHWTGFSWTTVGHFPVIVTVKLLWNNLYCIKRYINKGDLTFPNFLHPVRFLLCATAFMWS